MLVALTTEPIIFLKVRALYSLDLNAEFLALNAEFASVTDKENRV